jgi:hypothetical protein
MLYEGFDIPPQDRTIIQSPVTQQTSIKVGASGGGATE